MFVHVCFFGFLIVFCFNARVSSSGSFMRSLVRAEGGGLGEEWERVGESGGGAGVGECWGRSGEE